MYINKNGGLLIHTYNSHLFNVNIYLNYNYGLRVLSRNKYLFFKYFFLVQQLIVLTHIKINIFKFLKLNLDFS